MVRAQIALLCIVTVAAVILCHVSGRRRRICPAAPRPTSDRRGRIQFDVWHRVDRFSRVYRLFTALSFASLIQSCLPERTVVIIIIIITRDGVNAADRGASVRGNKQKDEICIYRLPCDAVGRERPFCVPLLLYSTHSAVRLAVYLLMLFG